MMYIQYLLLMMAKSLKGVIVEGGGLTGLRSLVERENGKMTLKSTPHFELLIELSQGEKI